VKQGRPLFADAGFSPIFPFSSAVWHGSAAIGETWACIGFLIDGVLNGRDGCGFARGTFTQDFEFTATKKTAAGDPVAENIGVGNRVLFLMRNRVCFGIETMIQVPVESR
jgi:hypothetical protein